MFRRHSLVGEIHTATHGFMTEWTVSGDTAGRTITLPLVAGYNYDCVIDWGDGSAKSVVTAFDDVNRIHTYSVAGKYKVEITGTCEGWSFNNAGDKLKITNILYWGNPLKFNDFKYLTGGFYGCTALKSLGRGSILFSGSGGFYETFKNCSSLTSLPVDLFKYSTAVSTNGFRGTFWGCTSLASLPVDLFRYNTLVSTWGFRETFYGCAKLQLHKWIFYSTGEEGTRFLNKTLSFAECFSLTSFTGTIGEAPELWNCNFGTGTPTKTDCFNGHSINSVSNYADIPAEWL